MVARACFAMAVWRSWAPCVVMPTACKPYRKTDSRQARHRRTLCVGPRTLRVVSTFLSWPYRCFARLILCLTVASSKPRYEITTPRYVVCCWMGTRTGNPCAGTGMRMQLWPALYVVLFLSALRRAAPLTSTIATDLEGLTCSPMRARAPRNAPVWSRHRWNSRTVLKMKLR